MLWIGFMVAASAWIGRRVIWLLFFKSMSVTWDGSTQTIQFGEDMEVNPCLMEVSTTPSCWRFKISWYTTGILAMIVYCVSLFDKFYEMNL
mmetsp:Transcript_48424/g.58623  ORF Transcript_48424/g.58623 Transcript_48424/m.58623 type:complete len:91 (+) Transcript_48424:5142-5414(+)